jgi:hypothetical protein
MSNEFTFKSGLVRKWLFAAALGVVALIVAFPPSLWICGAGIVLLVGSRLANSMRTGRWRQWQTGASLNWFEGWAASTGAVLVVLPLVAVLVRSWAS